MTASKLKLMIAIGTMAALSRETDSPVAEAVKVLKAPMTEEEKNKARGLSYFEMPDGTRQVGINYKTAHKKWLKKRQ